MKSIVVVWDVAMKLSQYDLSRLIINKNQFTYLIDCSF